MDRNEPQVLSEKLLRYSPYRELERRIIKGEFPIDASESENSFLALVLATLKGKVHKPFLVVLPGAQETSDFVSDISFFGKSVAMLPPWQTAAYRPAGIRSRIFGERSSVLASILTGDVDFIVASQRAFMTPVPPAREFNKLLFNLTPGQAFDPEEAAEKLSAYGYERVPRIALPGEFALRGEVLDLFMPGDANAYRILFGFDEIEKITMFDAELQSGHERAKSVTVRPLKEIVWTPELVERIRLRGERYPGCAGRMEAFTEKLETSGEALGEEAWYPAAYGDPHSILEYLDPSAIVFFLGRERLEAQEESFRKEFAGMYRPALREMPVPPPESSLNKFSVLVDSCGHPASFFALRDEGAVARLKLGCEPSRSYFGNVRYFREELSSLEKSGYSTYIVSSNHVQAERIASLLPNFRSEAILGSLSSGFSLPEIKIRVVQEGEIFGRRKHIPKSLATARSSVIDAFVELSPGDYVVHVNYGIGRFESIERMKVLGNEKDYIRIAYAEEETVFVPIEQANLVQRYIGNEGESPRLDKLGSKSWENRKTKVRKSVEELAERLIRIYARRKAAKGFAFPPDGEWQTEFEASFPYEETPDQLKCIDDVKKDMESPRPMDRLICGDVGYGKTEIALRACFKAVASGKQVAFLAPTTILAEQHFENFRERLGDYPVRCVLLSRLIERGEQKKILLGLANGTIDMVVGTHRILQKDIAFKDLGLLVIDEEQRFGVKDKERLKELKAGIDCLTLTATPIPRTLHMSLLKIRDMSVLQTPPSSRQSIQTFVEEYNPETIARGIRNEIARGGQVFYLHNKIQSLGDTELFIRSIVPEALTESAHGQMDARDLEDIMHRFIHGAFHVLVSTTIIENGIDIPNVNTIIIDRADNYGVSQLYQLRGRVGRSDRQAFAYLMYPDKRALSELAMKRLQIISDFTELGSGFKIAMKDLEVRGAGNLLGREQSGDIYAVGFDLYLKLLDDAVSALSGAGEVENEPYLELEYSGYIPDTYVEMPMIKMEIYKKLASILREEELEALHGELMERFGPMPDEVRSLLSLSEIRILCRKLSVATLVEKKGVVTVEFSKVAKISVERLLRLIRESGGRVKLDPHKPNAVVLQTKAIGLREKSEFIRERLASLLA
jgi:transcription-repair coupling factor (superfamily II helicase)